MSSEPFVFGMIAITILVLPMVGPLFGADEETISSLIWLCGLLASLGGCESACAAKKLERQLEDISGR